LDGSALGTVLAQVGMGAAFAWVLLRAPAPARAPRAELVRPLLRISGELFVRSAALLVAFATASAIVARVGESSLAAHQVAIGLFVFLALALDALAIAAQVLVGRALGAGDAGTAREAAIRTIGWSLVVGCVLGALLLALAGPLPRAFSNDPRVIDRAHAIWVMFAVMQPAAAVVFALDGVLIGAGDTRYLAGSMLLAGLGAYIPIALLALRLDWGIQGVWAGLLALMAVRLLTLGARFAGRRWAVVGPSARASAAGRARVLEGPARSR
jgi:putative MATE family efflux protein